jgi:hypothetical protein
MPLVRRAGGTGRIRQGKFKGIEAMEQLGGWNIEQQIIAVPRSAENGLGIQTDADTLPSKRIGRN